MNKFYLSLITCFIVFISTAQNKIILTGKLIDKESSIPINDATVYLSYVKDSTIIDYSISDKNGVFKFETKKITAPFFLKIVASGYPNYTQTEKECTKDMNFGVLSFLKKEIELSEVVVQSEAPPVKIKKDTLEFNAPSFKVRPDANVEALIRLLPGAEIDENKKITFNGKVVNKILVDGKPFFNEDGKIALQNLPADMIKKVQVSKTKTVEEEMSKKESSSDNVTINLTFKEDKNKGIFGKFMGGYGTDDRYETSGITSYFKNKRRITAIASSNNINATGFSMDDVFDNMGGGRNQNTAYFVSGSRNRNSKPTGITRSSLVGLNYDDEWSKGFDSHMAYNYNNLDKENRNKTSQADFLPSGNIFTNSEYVSNQLNEEHNADFKFEYKINDKTRIMMDPKISKTIGISDTNSQASSRDDNDQLMNENSSKGNAKYESGSIQNLVHFFKSFNKKRRFLYASLYNYNSKFDSNSQNNSTTLFYQDATPDDIRNQNILSKSKNDNYSINTAFEEPLTDSLSVGVSVYASLNKTEQDKNTFDFDALTGGYSDRNELLSMYYNSKTNRIEPRASFTVSKKNFYLKGRFGTYFTSMDNNSNYLGIHTNLQKNYVYPEGDFSFRYNFTKSKNIYTFYSREFNLPSATQILPVEDLSNPLNTVVGNSNLDIGKSHRYFINFSNFDTARSSGSSIFSDGEYRDSEIVSTSVYDDNGKQNTTYTNIAGTYYFNLGANWDKTFKKDLHTFKYGLKLKTGYQFQKGFTNSELFSAKIKTVSPSVSFSYEYGDRFTIRPSYGFTHNKTNYENYSIDEVSNREHNFKIEATNYFDKKWVFGNDFGYNYNSNISGGFKKDFYLWNTSLSYKTKDDQFVFKIKVYDILNQNQSATRTISSTSVTDSENLVLKRYGMFSLTYKFKKFGKKLETTQEPNPLTK